MRGTEGLISAKGLVFQLDTLDLHRENMRALGLSRSHFQLAGHAALTRPSNAMIPLLVR